MALETVVIKIKGDTKELDPTIKKLQKIGVVDKDNAKTFKKTSQQFRKSNKESEKSVGKLEKSIGRIGVAIAASFTIGALISFGKELARTAVQMEAFRKRAEVVFGDSIKFVEEFARKNAISLGLTQNQFLGAAAAIGDLLVPLGLSRKRAAEMSTQLVKLGGVLKEFTGDQRDASEISGIVARALTGETEGLKALGVTISQSSKEFQNAVKVKIRDEGLTQDQAKAVVIYETALARSTDALTAFETNTESVARQTAELNAQTQEVTETMATLFTPVLLAVTTSLNKVTKAQKLLTEADVSYFTKLKASFGIKSAQIEIGRATAKANLEAAEALEKIQEEITKTEGIEKKRATTIGDLQEKITKLKKEQKELSASGVGLAGNLIKIRDIEEKLKKIFDEATESIKRQGFEFKRLEPILAENLELMKELDPELVVFDDDDLNRVQKFWKDYGDGIQAAGDIAISVAEIRTGLLERELQEEQVVLDKGLERLETQLDKRIINEEKFNDEKKKLEDSFDKKRAEFQTKQAKADKAAAIFSSLINTAAAVIAALVSIPPNIPLSVIVGVVGAAQTAAIAAQPIPKFHKGRKGEFSDEEIPALIRKSEYVIPPEQSRKHREDLDAMLTNKFDHFVFHKYQMPIIKQYSKMEQTGFSDFNITRHQRKQNTLLEQNNQLLRQMLPSMKRASQGWN